MSASEGPRASDGGPEPAFLELRGIRKAFGVVQAVGGVDLSFRAGEVHALVGENGAGKSTLIQVMAGVYHADAGEILIRGTPVRLAGPADAEAAGISVVYQELSLIPELDVAQNIYLHREPRRAGPFLDTRRLYAACRDFLRANELTIDPRARVSSLSVAQRQLVEIAKALSRDAALMVMDEPTASLTSVEQEHLFTVIRRLRSRGKAVLYVSHRLDEIFRIADVVSVLKDGVLVRTMPAASTTRRELVGLMVGRQLAEDMFPARGGGPVHPAGTTPRLAVRNLASPGRIDDISFDVWPGEIVGIAGLIGSGRTSLLRAIFGADRPGQGAVEVDGRRVGASPRAAIGAGIGFVTEDRKLEGLALDLTNLANVAATALPGRVGIYDGARARRTAVDVAGRVHLDPRALDLLTRFISGGNQQKVVVAKWLATRPRVLLCDEPTRGIDVGAKAEIYRLLRELASAGLAVVFASSELPEVLGLADRILVLREGRLVATMPGAGTTEEQVMQAAAMEDVA